MSAAGIASRVLRATRRWRGWRVETHGAFVTQVRLAARELEAHPQLRALWMMGRTTRIQALNAKMQEALRVTCGQGVMIDVMTDETGAIGEAYLGYWIASFRIELDRRRRERKPDVVL